MKKSSLALSVLLAFSSLSYADKYEMRAIEIKMAQWQPMPPSFSNWRNIGEPYNCLEWKPSTSSVNGGSSFIQQRTCSQDKIGHKYQEEVDVVSKQTRILFDGDINSTSDIVQHQESEGTKNHVIGQSLGQWTEWEKDEELEKHSCTDWLPLVEDQPMGADFEQSRTCTEPQKREQAVFDDYYDGSSIEVDVNIEKQESDIEETRDAIGTGISRDMCIDKLNRGITSNGHYTVDPDGDGPMAAKRAYCDMSGGGWTLWDNFGSDTSESGYNRNMINSKADIGVAGYSSSLTTVNTTQYTRHNRYMQWFYSSTPQGWIKKRMPSWIQGVRADITNQWYTYGGIVTYNGESVEMGSYQGHTKITFNGGGGELKVIERGIIWIDSVWVK